MVIKTDATDVTVGIRKVLSAAVNTNPQERKRLEEEHGQVWDPDQLREEFEVIGFAMPLVVVKRKSDGKKGSLFFQANPRYYFWWQEDHKDN